MNTKKTEEDVFGDAVVKTIMQHDLFFLRDYNRGVEMIAEGKALLEKAMEANMRAYIALVNKK